MGLERIIGEMFCPLTGKQLKELFPGSLGVEDLGVRDPVDFMIGLDQSEWQPERMTSQNLNKEISGSGRTSSGDVQQEDIRGLQQVLKRTLRLCLQSSLHCIGQSYSIGLPRWKDPELKKSVWRNCS